MTTDQQRETIGKWFLATLARAHRGHLQAVDESRVALHVAIREAAADGPSPGPSASATSASTRSSTRGKFSEASSAGVWYTRVRIACARGARSATTTTTLFGVKGVKVPANTYFPGVNSP